MFSGLGSAVAPFLAMGGSKAPVFAGVFDFLSRLSGDNVADAVETLGFNNLGKGIRKVTKAYKQLTGQKRKRNVERVPDYGSGNTDMKEDDFEEGVIEVIKKRPPDRPDYLNDQDE